MRLLTLATIGCLLMGCASPVVLVFPGFAATPVAEEAELRVPDGCRYSSIVVTHARASRDALGDDVELSARVAELMRREFARRGATITPDPLAAYWSLMVLAASDARHYDGFLFSATLALRDMHEGRDPGITAYGESGDLGGTPTVYAGLGYGPGYALEATVRDFVRRADAALLPAARGLCEHEARERSREAELEAALPVPL